MSLFIRLVIAMVALVLITAASVGILAYRNLEEAILPRALERIETHARLLAANLNPMYAARVRMCSVSGRRWRLRASCARILPAVSIPLGGTTEAAWRERMAAATPRSSPPNRHIASFASSVSIMAGVRSCVWIVTARAARCASLPIPNWSREAIATISPRRSRCRRRCLCFAGRPEAGTRPGQSPASSDPARRYADPRPERAAFWNPRHQCRYEADL